MLNSIQKEAFQKEAKELEVKKLEAGYMAGDLVALGYYLIKNNLDKAEETERVLAEADELIRRAEELLNR